MVYFVIAGKPECPQFIRVAHLANYLQKELPNFKVKKIQLCAGEFENWLIALNLKHNWHHYTSPIIWKELLYHGGDPHLIGGMSHFWEYCYDYYGLESLIPQTELESIINEYIKSYHLKEEELHSHELYVRNICIYGAKNPLIKLLIPELLKIENLGYEKGISIALFDNECIRGEEDTFLNHIIEDVHQFDTVNIFIVSSIIDALKNCDLLLIIEDFERNPNNEDEDLQVLRNVCKINYLSSEINSIGKRSVRVVFACTGRACFYANVMVENCTLIRPANIVVVSSDLGLGPLQFAAKQAQIPLETLSAPPVWGYIGNGFDIVDITSSIKKCEIYKPYKRAIMSSDGSTLTHGTISTELRFINYLLNDCTNLHELVKQNREGINARFGRQSTYAKVSAITNLLSLWYGNDNESIISLGILGNGSNGVPSGLVFSQPAILVNNIWVPFKNYPVPPLIKVDIESAVKEAFSFLEYYNKGYMKHAN